MTDAATKTRTTKPVGAEPSRGGASTAQPGRLFSDFVEQGLAQAKDAHERMMAASEDATEVIREVLATAAKGSADCHLRMIEMARANANAVYDFAGELMAAESLSELMELSNDRARRQIDSAAEQFKQLSALAQKVATETAEPIKANLSRTFKHAA
jgi:phasin